MGDFFSAARVNEDQDKLDILLRMEMDVLSILQTSLTKFHRNGGRRATGSTELKARHKVRQLTQLYCLGSIATDCHSCATAPAREVLLKKLRVFTGKKPRFGERRDCASVPKRSRHGPNFSVVPVRCIEEKETGSVMFNTRPGSALMTDGGKCRRHRFPLPYSGLINTP